jgi:hypothetical protein
MSNSRYFPHQTLDSNNLRVSGGMAAYSLAAGGVNVGMDSMVMAAVLHKVGNYYQHTRNCPVT